MVCGTSEPPDAVASSVHADVQAFRPFRLGTPVGLNGCRQDGLDVTCQESEAHCCQGGEWVIRNVTNNSFAGLLIEHVSARIVQDGSPAPPLVRQ